MPVPAFRYSLFVFAVVVIGLLAGVLLGTGMDVFALRTLPKSSWVLHHQAMDALFRRVMPAFFNIAMLALIAASFVARGRARHFFAAAAVLALVCIVITVRIEVPMNRLIATWTAESVPSNWTAIRDGWLRFHLYRTVTGILAFLCAVVGLAQT